MSSINTEGVKQRKNAGQPLTNGSVLARSSSSAPDDDHPLGAPKHGLSMQLLRILGFGIFFTTCSFFIHFAQLLGVPLYFVSKDWFNAYVALTKAYFGILVTTGTQWWSPTVIRISGDKSMKGLLKQRGESGMLDLDFGERAIVIANHQPQENGTKSGFTGVVKAISPQSGRREKCGFQAT